MKIPNFIPTMREIIVAELEENHIEDYGDPYIASYEGKVPTWLKWVYVIAPIWGIIWFYLYWNGVQGWLDRGYWQQLQRAANTTYPFVDQDDPGKEVTIVD